MVISVAVLEDDENDDNEERRVTERESECLEDDNVQRRMGMKDDLVAVCETKEREIRGIFYGDGARGKATRSWYRNVDSLDACMDFSCRCIPNK